MNMPTKTISIDWEGKEEKVVIKRLTYGEKAEFEDATTEVTVVNGQPQVKIKRGEMRILPLLFCIKTAPFNVDRTTISNLPPEVGETLYKEIEEFNSFDIKKKGNSSGNSVTEQKPQKTQE